MLFDIIIENMRDVIICKKLLIFAIIIFHLVKYLSRGIKKLLMQ